jgi:outer membrane biosynthesis protein TonB
MSAHPEPTPSPPLRSTLDQILEAYRTAVEAAMRGQGGEVRASTTVGKDGRIVDAHIDPARIRPLMEDK